VLDDLQILVRAAQGRQLGPHRLERLAHLEQRLELHAAAGDEDPDVVLHRVVVRSPHERAAAAPRPRLGEALDLQDAQSLADGGAAETRLRGQDALDGQRRPLGQLARQDPLSQRLGENVGGLRDPRLGCSLGWHDRHGTWTGHVPVQPAGPTLSIRRCHVPDLHASHDAHVRAPGRRSAPRPVRGCTARARPLRGPWRAVRRQCAAGVDESQCLDQSAAEVRTEPGQRSGPSRCSVPGGRARSAGRRQW
jgi:hypothetical protein